jgi:ATP-dependent RNA helicase RhlE
LTTTNFASLGLAEPLLRALTAENYQTPTPIQGQAIPALLAGKDLLGVAQTGTGKTAAFALPILQHLSAERATRFPKSPRALILAPTRELALQIAEAFRAYGRHLGLRQAVIMGGVSFHQQIQALHRGVDILVATPGRLLDLMQQNHVRLERVTHLVLDEADRMLDMGFVRDVRRIVAGLPKRRHSMFFSATMPAEVTKLAGEMLHQPVRVEVTPQVITVDKIRQQVHFVGAADKRDLLVRLLTDPALARVIVFTRTKHGANKVASVLDRAKVAAEAIHGNKSQNARQGALERFRSGGCRVLVATDIAARGIDVDGITHVVNFDIPNVPETYVHRIGRTARAGAEGVAISLCDHAERGWLRDIERLTRRPIAVAGGRADQPAPRPAHQPRPAQAQRPAHSGKPAGGSMPASAAQQQRRPAPQAKRRGGDADWHRDFARTLNRGYAGAR